MSDSPIEYRSRIAREVISHAADQAEKGTESRTALTAWLSSARHGETGAIYMPNLKLQQAARERARKIREVAVAFRRELQIQRVAEIHPTTEDSNNVRLFVVKLSNAKSQRRAA